MIILTEGVSNDCQSAGPVGVSDGVMTPRKNRKSGRVMSVVGSRVSQALGRRVS